MASRALFGNSSSRTRHSNNLVEFKAGKMTLKGKMCHADKRKGLLYVYESEDSLMHFCWKDRTSGEVEDDLLIFPDDVTFKHVPQCKTGRVYVLKFNNSSRKFIFWMQEPKADKDEEHCNKVNKFLNTPATPGGGGRFGAGGGGGVGMGGLSNLAPELANLAADGDLQSLLSNMSQQQLIQLLGSMGGLGSGGGLGGLRSGGGGARPTSSQLSHTDPPTPMRVQSSPGPRTAPPEETSDASPATTAPQRPVTAAPAAPPGRSQEQEGTTPSGPTPAGGGAIQLSDLQSILQSMNVPGAAGTAAAERSTPVDLVGTLGSSEAMIPILANPDVQARLTPFLPTGEILPSSVEELRNTFASQQYHQALRSFGEALQSGQLGPLLNQFGLSPEAVEAANRGDVGGFARAVQDSEKEAKVEKMDENP